MPVVRPHFPLAHILGRYQMDGVSRAQIDIGGRRAEQRRRTAENPLAHRSQSPDACIHMLQEGAYEFVNLGGFQVPFAQVPV